MACITAPVTALPIDINQRVLDHRQCPALFRRNNRPPVRDANSWSAISADIVCGVYRLANLQANFRRRRSPKTEKQTRRPAAAKRAKG
jgi:hypothetical protein